MAFTFGFLIFLHTIITSDAFSKRNQLKQDLKNLKDQNQELFQHLETLKFRMQALQKRKDVQEHVIRDELGYVHPEDLIIDLDAKQK